MNIDFVLTAFSPAMFGRAATAHIKTIAHEEAQAFVGSNSRIMANRAVHEKLARNLFPQASRDLARGVDLRPGVNAIHVQYRGPQIDEDGKVPTGGVVTFFLIEVEEYQAPT